MGALRPRLHRAGEARSGSMPSSLSLLWFHDSCASSPLPTRIPPAASKVGNFHGGWNREKNTS